MLFRELLLTRSAFLCFVIHNLPVPIITLNRDMQATIPPTTNHLVIQLFHLLIFAKLCIVNTVQ